ncbi:MAG: thioredoxin family protein [Oligoflexales bacterium]|nr:thioredoxin family protein [Oligoflexales bacterium]
MKDWNTEELEEVLASGAFVFLKLWKRGCGSCKLSKPALEKIEEKNSYPLIFGQMNTDDFPEILELAETEVLPVFFLFKNKKMMGKSIGFKGQAKLQEFIDQHAV